jgi:two-component system, OmpR family, response regulator ArlR
MHVTPRVLIVHSGDPIGRMMAVALRHEGYEVLRTESATEATERLRALQPDVIVFDTPLSRDDKSQFMERWRRISPSSRIVEIGETTETPASSATGGPDAYQGYPFRIDSLLDKISDLLEHDPARTA